MYENCLKDNSTSLEDQDHMIAKLHNAAKSSGTYVGVEELESDHCPMMCMPNKLTQVELRFLEALFS